MGQSFLIHRLARIRRADYDLLLAQFNTYRDALLLQNATKVTLPDSADSFPAWAGGGGG